MVCVLGSGSFLLWEGSIHEWGSLGDPVACAPGLLGCGSCWVGVVVCVNGVRFVEWGGGCGDWVGFFLVCGVLLVVGVDWRLGWLRLRGFLFLVC